MVLKRLLRRNDLYLARQPAKILRKAKKEQAPLFR